MRVIHRIKGYKQCPTRYLHFNDYASVCGDIVLIEGGFTKPLLWGEYNLTSEQLAEIKSKRVVLLEFEEPNKFFVGDYPHSYDKDFYKIFTICPYTADWLNKKYKEKKRIPIFFPINERYIGPKRKKIIDIIYSGHIYSKELKQELEMLKKFNHAIISNSKDSIVSHRSVSYKQKMTLYSQAKIALVHNLIYTPYIHRIISVWFSGDFWNNKALKNVPRPWKPWELFTKKVYIPQLKSRVFEAAVNRALILCRKDEFNVIERYFEPNKEFVYYEPGSLQETVNSILNNYSKYEIIAERAYARAIKNYTTVAFVKKYLKNIANE